MPMLRIRLDGDNAWPDLQTRQADIIHMSDPDWELALLSGGMKSGKSSVALRINLPDGRVLIVETSLALWMTANRALLPAYEREMTP